MKKDSVNPLYFFSGLMLCTGLSFAQGNGNKVPVCHIPPGNPSDAKTIYVGAPAVAAHLAHGDFQGDCWSGQYGGSVEMFHQGLQNNGTPVVADRSNPSEALGAPDCGNQPGGFVSLGFGGYIILKMDGGILNIPGNDLRICETTFGNRTCAQYPEYARIYVSQDMQTWADLGTLCQDGEVDIAPLNWVLYVKIVDESNPTAFGSQVVDGYDVDGVRRIMPSASRQAVAGNANAEDDFFYPNPVDDVVRIDLSSAPEDASLTISLVDLKGKIMKKTSLLKDSNQPRIDVDCRELPGGQYLLTVEGAGLNETFRIFKK
jgi:hypothetical protein